MIKVIDVNRKMAIKKVFLFLALAAAVVCLSLETVSAQHGVQPEVKGVVKNDLGETLAGATIWLKGSKTYATSDKDGKFTLRNVQDKATLRVLFVGHLSREITLKPGQAFVSVELKSSGNNLKEVLVNTGLYRRPKGNFTGAAKTFTGDELKSVNPSNVLKALSVLEPSVRMQENNIFGSDPNKLPNIQMRGQNNLPLSTQGGQGLGSTPVSNGDLMSGYLSNPNQPLIILDGFQTTLQAIYDMDINRIASITVLKDAAATTAYGSKAANGVIVVESKQPMAGKTEITYSVNLNVDLPDLSSYHLMDAEELLEAQRLAGIYSDAKNQFNDAALKRWYDYRLYQAKSGVNTDWLAQPVRTGIGSNHSLTISGALKQVRYSLNINYGNNVGVMKASGREKAGVSYMLSYNTRRLRFANTIKVDYAKGNNTPWGSYSQYASLFPFFKPYDADGHITKILEPSRSDLGFDVPAPGGTFVNPMYNATLATKDYSYYLSFTNNTAVDWTMSRDLKMRAAISFGSNSPAAEQFYPPDHTIFAGAILSGFTDLGTYSQTRGHNGVIDGRLSFDYTKKMGRHTLLASVGTQAQATTSRSTVVKVSGIPNDYLGELGLANGYGSNDIKPVASKNISRNLSSYASVSYNYDNRYTAEVTMNTSGSSQFGSENKFAPFWAGGLAWNVDKENFFKENSVIQDLRIRLTTGITGNQNFGASLAQPIYNYSLSSNYRLQLGAILQDYANPALKWQQTLKNNLGVTAGFFKGGLNVSFDYFDERTDNLILPLEVAPSTGFLTYMDNLGATQNTGYELSLSAPVIRNKTRNIFWTLLFNTGHYRNVITKLSPAIEAINSANNSDDISQTTPLPRFVVGQSMTQIWAVKSLGIDPATGREVFEKLDGTRTFVWDPRDKQPVGDAMAKFKGMFGSNFNYKGFVFNINFLFEYGGQMYNQTLLDKIENINLLATNADKRVLSDRWKAPGDHSSYKSLVANGTNGLQLTNSTSRFVQDNNYIQASSITVGYNFPQNANWVRKLKLSAPRLFITQNDVFRFATIKTERGTGYPFARSFSLGLSTTF